MDPMLLLHSALKSIYRNRMRSLLTMLGIIIGVASIIDMVGIGNGAQVQIEEQIRAMGTNVLMVRPGAASTRGIRMGAGSRESLTLEDAEALSRETEYFAAVSPVERTGGQVISSQGNWQTQVYGVNPSYLYIRDWTLESGMNITERDLKTTSKVAVLGKTVAQELFGAADPINAQIRIKNIPFRVIGVLESKGENAFGQNQDDIILAPITTVLNRMSGSRYVDQILASVVSEDRVEEATARLEEVLQIRHRIAPGEENDFSLNSQTELIERATQMASVMTLLLGAIAGVSLIVGGIGIMNIMLVSVTERTREIGIRMAIGARGSDIMYQFLVESVVISVIGGAIGIALALGIIWLLNDVFALRSVVVPGTIVLAFGFSAFVGIFFGYYPARKAARLNPIDALRYE